MAKKAGRPRKTVEPVKEEAQPRGLRKQYLKSGLCRVTFRLPAQAVDGAERVSVAGDFNGWDEDGIILKKLKSGDFSVSVDLEPGKEYRFRYLVDGARWENDWNADKYLPNPHGSEDSVVVV